MSAPTTIKPIKILLLIVLVNLVLLAVWLIFPDKAIPITKELSVKFPSPKEYFEPNVLKNEKPVTEKITKALKNTTFSEDSVQHFIPLSDEDIIVSANEKLMHPNDFENALEAFYGKLETIKDGQLLRVLHFGDSQIEGDRISGVLRDILQNKFGGCGVGYIPVNDPSSSRKNVSRTSLGKWTKHPVVRSTITPPHNNYSFLGSFYQWEKLAKNSSVGINIKKNKGSNQKLQQFEQISLMYRNYSKPFECKITCDTAIIHEGLMQDSGIFQQQWNYKGFGKGELNFRFSGDGNPDIYGISLDCKQGVAVDNISLRGSSGTDFTKMNKESLKQQVSKMNVGLIIYQFGVNVVPNEVAGYGFYRDMMVHQINYLKQIAPTASILVIGVSDMCKKEGSEFVSYGNIEKIRDAQKEAAQLTGCAFWDLYEVMGGHNSMAEWVTASPSLAEKDYTHFNWRGAYVVGEKLGNAILKDYYDFKKLEIY
jgi:hypothetical protein